MGSGANPGSAAVLAHHDPQQCTCYLCTKEPERNSNTIFIRKRLSLHFKNMSLLLGELRPITELNMLLLNNKIVISSGIKLE